MAQFDVYAEAQSDVLLLDCQADLLSDLDTRLIVPLMIPPAAPRPAGRLNPSFHINGTDYVMVTQFAGAVGKRDLRKKVASLGDRGREITNALDLLITGV